MSHIYTDHCQSIWGKYTWCCFTNRQTRTRIVYSSHFRCACTISFYYNFISVWYRCHYPSSWKPYLYFYSKTCMRFNTTKGYFLLIKINNNYFLLNHFILWGKEKDCFRNFVYSNFGTSIFPIDFFLTPHWFDILS